MRLKSRGVSPNDRDDSASPISPPGNRAPSYEDATQWDADRTLHDPGLAERGVPKGLVHGDATQLADSVNAEWASEPIAPSNFDPDATRLDPSMGEAPLMPGPFDAKLEASGDTDPNRAIPHSNDATDAGVDRTYFAMAGVELGTQFKHQFALEKFGLSPRYLLELKEPSGPSTAQGLWSRQSIILYPEGHKGDRTLMIGWLDPPERQAMLRTYALVSTHYVRRFKRPFDLSESEFMRIMGAIRQFARRQGFRVHELNTDPIHAPMAHDPTPSGTRRVSLRMIYFGLLLVLGLGVALGYALRGS